MDIKITDKSVQIKPEDIESMEFVYKGIIITLKTGEVYKYQER